MMIVKRSALTVGLVATLFLTACGGGDGEGEGDDVDDAAVTTVATEEPVETSPPTDPPVVEVPADWLPSIPVPEIDGMLLAGAVVRGEGADARYELRYDGEPLDAQVVYDGYEALVLAEGWTVRDDSDPLFGSYELEGRTMDIVVDSDEAQTRLTVSVATV